MLGWSSLPPNAGLVWFQNNIYFSGTSKHGKIRDQAISHLYRISFLLDVILVNSLDTTKNSSLNLIGS